MGTAYALKIAYRIQTYLPFNIAFKPLQFAKTGG